MNETEAQNFVNDVLKGLWTDWEPTDAQYSLWARRLLRFHYGRAKVALENWLCEAKRTYKSPPINNILKYLGAMKAWDSGMMQPKAVLVFKFFNQDNPNWEMPFYESSIEALKRRDPDEIEREMSTKRVGCNLMYKGNWVLVLDENGNRPWIRHFERIPI